MAAADADAGEVVAAQPVTYVLKPGDNLTRVSARYGTTVQALLDANGLTDGNRIFVGQELIILGVVAVPADVVEVPMDTPPIAYGESQPVADVPVSTDTSTTAALDTAADAPTTYTVQPGDSAIGIALEFGVDVDVLLTANGVVNRDRVYIGQVLTIPAA
jgi:LysM repeat protein